MPRDNETVRRLCFDFSMVIRSFAADLLKADATGQLVQEVTSLIVTIDEVKRIEEAENVAIGRIKRDINRIPPLPYYVRDVPTSDLDTET